MATFGRALQGEADALPGFEQCMVRIGNYEVVTTSGKTYHPNVKYTGGQGNRVSGTVFEVSDAELAAADQYEERAGFKRIIAALDSGRQAWVYLDDRPTSDAS